MSSWREVLLFLRGVSTVLDGGAPTMDYFTRNRRFVAPCSCCNLTIPVQPLTLKSRNQYLTGQMDFLTLYDDWRPYKSIQYSVIHIYTWDPLIRMNAIHFLCGFMLTAKTGDQIITSSSYIGCNRLSEIRCIKDLMIYEWAILPFTFYLLSFWTEKMFKGIHFDKYSVV